MGEVIPRVHNGTAGGDVAWAPDSKRLATLCGAWVFLAGMAKPAPVDPPPVESPLPQDLKASPVAEEPQPTIVKVYADRATHLYYPSDCARHPEDAPLIAKTVATMQGYKPAPCK